MSWEIKERQAGPVVVLEISGRMTLTEGSDPLDSKLQDLIAGGVRAVLLDCSRVTGIDSRGLKALVRGLISMRKREGGVKLLRPSERERHLLEMTRLSTVVEIYDDEAAALASFSS
jgi:anti-sigma B factor antagonist